MPPLLAIGGLAGLALVVACGGSAPHTGSEGTAGERGAAGGAGAAGAGAAAHQQGPAAVLPALARRGGGDRGRRRGGNAAPPAFLLLGARWPSLRRRTPWLDVAL